MAGKSVNPKKCVYFCHVVWIKMSFMRPLVPYTINVHGRLLQLDKPKVMGILNLSDESFYASVSAPTREKVFSGRVGEITTPSGFDSITFCMHTSNVSGV